MSFRRMRHVKAREFQGCDIAYDFSNPANLYDATSGGSLVAADGGIARANDVSGNTGHMLQSTSGKRPLRKVAVLNGMDVARFDGTSDYLNAGDVGDFLANPVEVFAVHKKTANTQYPGIFVKTKAGNGFGRWGLMSDLDTQKHTSFVDSKTGGGAPWSGGPARNTTNTELLHAWGTRTAGTNAEKTRMLLNATTLYEGTAYTADTSSADTAFNTYIGVHPNATGAAPLSTGYYGGDIGECAKYSVTFSAAQRLRLDASRCRKWRIKT